MITLFWILCEYILEATYEDDMHKLLSDYHTNNAETEEEKDKWIKIYTDYHSSHVEALHKITMLIAVIISTAFTLYFYMITKRFAHHLKEKGDCNNSMKEPKMKKRSSKSSTFESDVFRGI